MRSKGMIASIINIVILLCSLVLVRSECPPPTITRLATNRVIMSKPEWKVEITNTCVCTVLDLKLTTVPEEFAPVVPIDTAILNKDKSGKYWIVNDGQPLYGFKSFNFTYIGDPVEFSVFDFKIGCSV